MKTIIYRGDNLTDGVKPANPLPVTMSYDSTNSFNATLDTPSATTAQTLKTATSGKSIYVTDLVFSSGTTMAFQLLDGDGTVLLPWIYTTANYPYNREFSTPLKVTASKALKVKTSTLGEASIAVTGYVA